MANDRQVISYLTPAELAALMNAGGIITVRDIIVSDGKPVIHAALKVVNADTGEQLPGGLPFSVVMFKNQNEPGYSNIAVGTIVPAAELRVSLPKDYFNFCNQRFRFTRVFPVDDGAFVIQMDLMLKNATREYVKFSFGLWGALYSQVLFELMGRGRESLIVAAEAYAQVHCDFASQIAASPAAVLAEPAVHVVEPAVAQPDTVMPLEAETIIPDEANVVEHPDAVEIEASEAGALAAADETADEGGAAEPAQLLAETTNAVESEAPDASEVAVAIDEPLSDDAVPLDPSVLTGDTIETDLTIVAGPEGELPLVAETAVEAAAEKAAGENAQAKEPEPV